MPRMPNECFSNIASKYWSRHSNINPWLSDAEIASFAHSDSFLFHLTSLGGACYKTVKVLVAQLRLTLCDPMDYIACQASLSVELSRQEHWIGLPFPSPGDLPNPGIKPRSLDLQADSLPSEPPDHGVNSSISTASTIPKTHRWCPNYALLRNILLKIRILSMYMRRLLLILNLLLSPQNSFFVSW